MITGIAIIRGTFLLNLSDEELPHFLTTLLVRCIAFLHAGYDNLTIWGHILFYEVLKHFLKLLIALDHHLLQKETWCLCSCTFTLIQTEKCFPFIWLPSLLSHLHSEPVSMGGSRCK